MTFHACFIFMHVYLVIIWENNMYLHMGEIFLLRHKALIHSSDRMSFCLQDRPYWTAKGVPREGVGQYGSWGQRNFARRILSAEVGPGFPCVLWWNERQLWCKSPIILPWNYETFEYDFMRKLKFVMGFVKFCNKSLGSFHPVCLSNHRKWLKDSLRTEQNRTFISLRPRTSAYEVQI